MTNLVNFNTDDGVELVFNQATGEAFATQSGYARMSGLTVRGIGKRLEKLVNSIDYQTGEIDTGYGLKLVNLIPAELVFKWSMKDNTDLALVMGAVGATVYLHQLAGFKVSSDAIALQSTQPLLPPSDVRVSNLKDALQFFGIDQDNPRYKQALQDLTLDILGVSQTTALPSDGQWVGVAERAEQLGYPVALVAQKRSQLGKYVKSYNVTECKQELRLCNGTQRPINVYLVSSAFDSVIREFFEGV